jgi:hypothetical protein
MSLTQKPLATIAEQDLMELLTNAVPEGLMLDYKRDLPGGADGDKREFLADVSSFANSYGGDLLFGMEERDDRPVAVPGVPPIEAASSILRLESSIREGITPRINGVVSRVIALASGKCVLIIRIPRSFAAPHMVTFGNLSRFYARTTRGKYQLNVDELRRAFVAGETAREHAVAFRAERIAHILAGDTPIHMDDRAKVVLHMLPLENTGSSGSFPLDRVVASPARPKPLHSEHRQYRYNLNGLLFYASGEHRDKTHSYLQIFRSGALEAVCSSLVWPDGADKFIRTVVVEPNVIDGLHEYREFYAAMDVAPPFTAMVSLLGVQGYRVLPKIANRDWGSFRLPLAEVDLLLPDVQIADSSVASSDVLRSAFDVLWQAAGWERSMNYGPDGSYERGS